MRKTSGETCWTLVHGAADGADDARALFAQVYLPVIRAYLVARWRGGPMLERLDDAVQDTFLECFRGEGALGRLDGNGRFRTYLYAVVRNVARRYEERRAIDMGRHGANLSFVEPSSGAQRPSRVYDRAWLDTLLKRAAVRQAEWAEQQGDEARQRIELMRLRFVDGLPVRDIAERWGVAAAVVHREYRQARRDFKRALREEVAFHHPGATPEQIEEECAALLELMA